MKNELTQDETQAILAAVGEVVKHGHGRTEIIIKANKIVYINLTKQTKGPEQNDCKDKYKGLNE